MPSVSFFVHPQLRRDALFDTDPAINRDNILLCYRALRDSLSKSGIDCHTHDVFEKNKMVPDLIIFENLPRLPVRFACPDFARIKTRFAILNENHVIQPLSWKTSRHAGFDKIFTFRGSKIDNKKYFYLPTPQETGQLDDQAINLKNRKFSCLISGNKSALHRLELYSYRNKLIDWFTKNHPDEMDLYGFGWDQYVSRSRVINFALKRLGFSLKSRPPAIYRGDVVSKSETISKYKFSFAIENAKGIDGYISEKIFDVIRAGAIPVYCGAPDICALIPDDVFISMDAFDDFPHLYSHLKNMDETEILKTLKAGRDFMRGERARRFSVHNYTEILTGHIISAVNQT